MPSLTHIILIDEPEEAPGGVLHCYGWNTAARKIRVWPGVGSFQLGHDEVYCSWISHFWKTILHAVADSGLSTIQHLETALTYRGWKWILWRDFDCSPALLSKLHKCFNNLQSLKLQVRSKAVRDENPPLLPSETSSRGIQNLYKYSSVFKNAKALHYTGDNAPSSGKLFVGLISKFNFKTLTRLVIESCSIDHQRLAGILCLAGNAETIALHAINLERGTWTPILQALLKLPKLNHLHLWYPSEDQSPVSFFKLPEQPLKGHKSLAQQYQAMQHHGNSAEVLQKVYGLELVDPQAPKDKGKNYLYKTQDQAVADIAAGASGQHEKPLVYTAKRPKCDHKYRLLPPLGRPINDTVRASKFCFMGTEIATQLPSFIEIYKKNKGLDPDEESIPGPNNLPIPLSTASLNHAQHSQQSSHTPTEEAPTPSENASEADADIALHDAGPTGSVAWIPTSNGPPLHDAAMNLSYHTALLQSVTAQMQSMNANMHNVTATTGEVHALQGGQVHPDLVSLDTIVAPPVIFDFDFDLIAAQNLNQLNALPSIPTSVPSTAPPMPSFSGPGPILTVPLFSHPWVPSASPATAGVFSDLINSLDLISNQAQPAVANNTNEAANAQPAADSAQSSSQGGSSPLHGKNKAKEPSASVSDETHDASMEKMAAEFKDVGGLLGHADLLNEHDAGDFESDGGEDDTVSDKK